MTTVTTLGVTGMTCSHCVKAVGDELGTVAGVGRVAVELRNGGTSAVRVFSDAALDEGALRAAIDEAGYDLESYSVLDDALTAQIAAQAGARREAAALTGALPIVAPDAPAAAESAEAPVVSQADGHGGCACGCGGKGRQGLGIGLPIVAK